MGNLSQQMVPMWEAECVSMKVSKLDDMRERLSGLKLELMWNKKRG